MAVDEIGRVMFVRHSYQHRGSWMLPAGGLLRDEHPTIGAQRELLEETGCVMNDPRELDLGPVSLSGSRGQLHVVVGVTRDNPVSDGREIIDAKFFAPWELPENVESGSLWRIGKLQEALERVEPSRKDEALLKQFVAEAEMTQRRRA